MEFPESQYIKQETTKKQIYLHHTAGNPSGEGVFQWFEQTSERVAVCCSISGIGKNCVDGQIVQGFSSKYWAYHLGLKQDVFTHYKIPYQSLDKISIAIEICNWGNLTLKNGKYYNYVGGEVSSKEVCKLDTPFKGITYFHNYTDAQIQSTKELLLLWKEKYNIPLTYNPDIFDVTTRALKGDAGVYTHNSVRPDKVDIYPHPKMIEMLKSLEK